MTEPDAEPGAVLLVDDESGIRRLCERYLVRLGHRVVTTSSVVAALAQLEQDTFDVVVTDLRLPDRSGLELLTETRLRAPGTRTILMSGKATTADAAAAIERGVDRLLLKPLKLEDLQDAVERSLAEKRAQERILRDGQHYAELVAKREAESRTWILRAAHALASAVEAKHAYTAGHNARVTGYAVTLAEAVGGIDAARFELGCGLHDLGKIGVPDSVLNKPSHLSEEDLVVVRRHPLLGARILEPLIEDQLVLGMVRSHHERWDGTGYPDGLAGEEIPLEARVLAIADTLDAMTSSRAYRAGLPWAVAVAEIRRGAGAQFDPRLVEVFEQVLPRLSKLYLGFRSTLEKPG